MDQTPGREPHGRFTTGARRGRTERNAITHNVASFFDVLARMDTSRTDVRAMARRRLAGCPPGARAELQGLAVGSGVELADLAAFNLCREVVTPDACTAGVATGAATATGNTLFFKHSDAGLNEEFEGEHYHRHQEINVVTVAEGTTDANACLTVTGAGVTGVKMGVNEHGVAIGSTFARTTTYTAADQRGDDIAVSQGGSRSDLMGQALRRADTIEEATTFLTTHLATTPMDTPGTIFVADGDEAVVIEGEYTHLSVERVVDGVSSRANTFEVLDHLAVPGHEYPSTHYRANRIREVLEGGAGDISPETMFALSTDHTNGPGEHSICVHPRDESVTGTVDHSADERSATCSAVVFDLDGADPAQSRVYVALGTPCHAWRTAEGEGWCSLALNDLGEGVPLAFETGDAWLENYRPRTPVDEGGLPV